MSKNIKNNDKVYVYRINEFDYAGVSCKLDKRMQKHKSFMKLDYTPTYIILKEFNSRKDALEFEYKYQIDNNLPISKVRNQNGNNNPIARTVVNTITGAKYDTIKEAAIAEELNYGTLRNSVLNNDYYLQRI
tara:strand:+ start:5370 stop:5765 length:396 start_codon:yes stop_codon:yes gene_type:complete